MNADRYRWILYGIVGVIASTIALQVYWNYKNYLTNKQQLINDVQTSLDNAVDTYYTELAERHTISIGNEPFFNFNFSNRSSRGNLSGSAQGIFLSNRDSINIIDLEVDSLSGFNHFRSENGDSISVIINNNFNSSRRFNNRGYSTQYRFLSDSSSIQSYRLLTSKVITSMSQDSLDLKSIDSLLLDELDRKNISLAYELEFHDNHQFPFRINEFHEKKSVSDPKNLQDDDKLSTISKSSFLPTDSVLKISFSNETKTILKRSMSGILLSTLLVLAVIICLLYLLKIIQHQKQLAEVKNDLISNITHEFKTPIATIGVALESMKDFNALEDRDKAKNYLNISNDQLGKLNVMVEKLLETATLDSDSLKLKKEEVDLVELLKSITKKHEITTDKSISFTSNTQTIYSNIDIFHFENAIENILDNAIKYGGNVISVSVKKDHKNVIISISDSGNTLAKNHKDKIFEKFYRVPKGNTHDVKGFGIGLYYTKSIIQKHNGSISLELDKNTTFKISIPND